ncbi:MAG: phosphodiester glycosidase family protein [Clostridia bacterium]|nr:phosphodiester glycosidase family protein [Clostridia bacterium]
MRKLKGWLAAASVMAMLAGSGAVLAEDQAFSTPAPAATTRPSVIVRIGGTAVPAVTATPAAKMPLLPIDFSVGKQPVESAYSTTKDAKGRVTAWRYEDPTITVEAYSDRVKARNNSMFGCDYWVATVEIADASQLRTLSEKGFDRDVQTTAEKLAKRANAVLAINGDFYSFSGEGYILRQGKVFLDLVNVRKKWDVLQIDEDGDFHGLKIPKRGTVKDTIDGKRVINSFYFGPILVVDGKVQEFANDAEKASQDRKQRMAIAQVGPLKYMCICCAGPVYGNDGMTLREFANLIAQQKDVKIAYNLDGGDSTRMIFHGEKINGNREKSTSKRGIVDIIYFASAYEGK